MLDEKTIDELKSKHGPHLHLLEHREREIVVKTPSRDVYKRYKTSLGDETKRLEANAQLVRDCRVHPSAQELEQLFEELPAIADTFAGELLELAGAAKTASVRKL